MPDATGSMSRTPPLVSFLMRERACNDLVLSYPDLSAMRCEARSSSVTHVLFQGAFSKKRGG